MGVKNLHKFVQNRAQEAVLRHNLSDYLQSYSWGHGPRCLVIDGQNLAYTIVKETHSPGTFFLKFDKKFVFFQLVFVGCFGGEPAIYGEVMREFVERNLKDLDEVYFVIGNSVPAGTEEWKVRRERSGSFFFAYRLVYILSGKDCRRGFTIVQRCKVIRNLDKK